jgi:CTP:phosphocholine cytidylyltransferase-like protein
MNRYQFEVLTFLEKNGKNVYAIRTLSDKLKISGTEVSKALDELTNIGAILRNENLLEITAKGLDMLEPYRVKRAVIMAAGFGSRMVPVTLDRPKPMVKVNGVRIIDTLLDALVSVGIKDITLVRGYKKEKFDEITDKYPFIKFVDNDVYDKTNNISSAMAALEHIDECYLCEADLYISNPDIISKYQYSSNILGSFSIETDDWSYKLDNGYITDYKKGNTFCFNYYGISYWNKDDSKKLRNDFKQVYEEEQDGKDYFWEFIPLVLRKERYNVEVRPCEKSDIMEIDNFYELVQLDPSYKDYPGQE